MIHEITRRGFLRNAAMGTGTVVASAAAMPVMAAESSQSANDIPTDASDMTRPSFLAAPKPISTDQIIETVDTEVLIVGAGIGGATTASSCAECGLKVTLIDRAETPRAIGLDFGLVNPSILAEKGIDPENIYELTRDYVEKSAQLCRGDKVYRFMSKSGEAGDWWIEKARGYGFEPQVMAYASNSDHYRNNRGIIELWHAGINLANEEDCYAPMAEMLANLAQEVVDAGGDYRPNTTAVQLVQNDDGTVTGAICQNSKGYVRINASRGVVLAAGDYAGNPEMLAHYTAIEPEKFDDGVFKNYSTGDGSGQLMGLWAGAQMQSRPNPLMIFVGYGYGFLRVNRNGERYMNEDGGYVGAGNAQIQQPGGSAWAIWDANWEAEVPASFEYGGGMSWDQDFRRVEDKWTAENERNNTWSWEKEEGLLMEANTLDELADLIGYEGEAKQTFLATVARYNELAISEDTDFGKRSELMTTISEPPFYALKLTLELGVSVGGLMTNADSECLDANGRPIGGLYAVGNNAGGEFGADYNEVTVPGISIGRCVTFGYLLGRHLAGRK